MKRKLHSGEGQGRPVALNLSARTTRAVDLYIAGIEETYPGLKLSRPSACMSLINAALLERQLMEGNEADEGSK